MNRKQSQSSRKPTRKNTSEKDEATATEKTSKKAKFDAQTAIETLRIGIGVTWALNLIFIVLPAAQYFSTFHDVATGYGPTTLGGPGIANYVAAHSLFFEWLIALATGYLAVAFTLGFTTRLAIVVGTVASVFFVVTQFWATFMFPGGTDVGAHPLYLVIYLSLFLGGAGRMYSVDHLISQELARIPRVEGESPRGIFWVLRLLCG